MTDKEALQAVDAIVEGIEAERQRRIAAELAAIRKRSAHAKRTNKAAIALFHDMAAMPGVHVGRISERTAIGRFAADDE